MGAHASKEAGQQGVNTTSMQGHEGTVQSGPHSKLPEDETPYPGPKLEYSFTNITAKRNTEAKFSVDGESFSLMTTDVESYHSTLVQAYQDGFTLSKFQTIPGVNSPELLCQGIFTRPIGLPSGGEWRLEISKNYMKPQEFFSVNEWKSNEGTNVSVPVMKKVEEMSKNGARFVCIEITGKPTDSSRSNVIGVDLFFHLPQHTNSPSFVYRGVNVPVTYSMLQMDEGLFDLHYQCHTDLDQQLTSVLQQGWKLVDVCLDSSSLTKSDAFSSGHMTMSSMWFFEKEASHIEDSIPRWEGTIISYQHQVKNSKNVKKSSRSTWDPVLVEMGEQGWELACILETPETRQTGSNSRTITLLLFFQRPVVSPSSQS